MQLTADPLEGFSASQPENIRPNLALRKKAAGGPVGALRQKDLLALCCSWASTQARRALSERPEKLGGSCALRALCGARTLVSPRPSSPSFRAEIASESVQDRDLGDLMSWTLRSLATRNARRQTATRSLLLGILLKTEPNSGWCGLRKWPGCLVLQLRSLAVSASTL